MSYPEEVHATHYILYRYYVYINVVSSIGNNFVLMQYCTVCYIKGLHFAGCNVSVVCSV